MFYEKYNNQYGTMSTLRYFKDAYAISGDWQNAYKVTNEAKEILKSLPYRDNPVLLNQLEWCPWIYVWSGRYAEAESVMREAKKFYQERQEIYTALVFLCDLSLALGVQGKITESLSFFNELDRHYRDHQDRDLPQIARLLGCRGYVLTQRGDLQDAENDLKKSLEIKMQLKDDVGIPEIHNWLGELNETKAAQLEGAAKTTMLKNAECNYLHSLKLRYINRYYFECGALAGLARVNYSLGNYPALLNYLTEAEKLAQQYEYNDYIASLGLLQGHLSFLLMNQESFNQTLHYYQQSLVYALRYNRFLLDEILSGHSSRKVSLLPPITHVCKQHSKEGKRMLESLCSWWHDGTNDTGKSWPETISPIPELIPLENAEKIARERERGNGSRQRTVNEQINEELAIS